MLDQHAVGSCHPLLRGVCPQRRQVSEVFFDGRRARHLAPPVRVARPPLGEPGERDVVKIVNRGRALKELLEAVDRAGEEPNRPRLQRVPSRVHRQQISQGHRRLRH